MFARILVPRGQRLHQQFLAPEASEAVMQSETANSNLFRSVQARLISSLAFLLLQCSAQLLTPMISCILRQLTRNSRLLLLLLFLLLFFLFLAFRILTVPYLYLHILNSILKASNQVISQQSTSFLDSKMLPRMSFTLSQLDNLSNLHS